MVPCSLQIYEWARKSGLPNFSWEGTEEDRVDHKWAVTGSWLLSTLHFWFRQCSLPRRREDSMGTTLLPSPFLWALSSTTTRHMPGLLFPAMGCNLSIQGRMKEKQPSEKKNKNKNTKPTNKQKHLHTMDPGWKTTWRTQGKTESTTTQGCLILLKRGLRSGTVQTKGIRSLMTTTPFFFHLF